MKIKKRRDPIKIKERDIRIATDYNAGMVVKDIMKRYSCARQTVYNALNRVVKY